MADINALFEELGKLTPEEAKALSDKLKAKMPQPAETATETEPADAE